MLDDSHGAKAPWPFDTRRAQFGPIKRLAVALGVAALAVLVAVGAKTPRHDREWRAEIAVLPEVSLAGDRLTVSEVRDWTYTAEGPRETAYRPRSEELENLRGLWLMVEPFGGSPAIAHTLVLFEFEGGRLLGLTIEARKEVGEIYSPVDGALNTYELGYIWAEARDLLVRRVRYLRHEVYVYPLDLSAANARSFLTGLAETSMALSERPRFYNTLFSNCTNELAKTAGVNWTPAFILTGYAAPALYDADVIPGAAQGVPFEAVRARADMTAAIARLPDGSAEAFDRALLAELSRRFRRRSGS
ncbi:MAG: DUF4105 domain-containing protein [Pseudomonadota bacterium]